MEMVIQKMNALLPALVISSTLLSSDLTKSPSFHP